MTLYKIVRFFSESGKGPERIKGNLSLEEAQEHCANPMTREEGVYFDGYTKE